MYQSRIRDSKRRHQKKREIIEPDDGQEYAIVQDMVGNGRVRVLLNDKTTRLARIRGSLRKYTNKVIIERGDLVLIANREYGDDKVDIFHKFFPDEVAWLVRHECLPEYILKIIHQGDTTEERTGNDDYVVFMEGGTANTGSARPSDNGSESNAAGSHHSSDEIDIDAI